MQNPIGGLGGAMLSHYFLDSFKHWDYSIENLKKFVKNEKNKNLKSAAIDFLKIILDLSLGFLALSLFFKNDPQFFLILLGGFFGALPDGLQVLHFTFPDNKVLAVHQEFHDFMHFSKKEKLIFPNGILSEIAVILIAILLFRL